MRLSSPPPFSRPSRARQGFTLLEMTIAMSFVALLAAGITLSISTCLNVWKRSAEAADLHQEARALIELLSRDIRGAYLGLEKTAGYLIGVPAQSGEDAVDTLIMCTESSSLSRTALLPEEMQIEWHPESHPLVTDYVAVRYEQMARKDGGPQGLYRTASVAPNAISGAGLEWQIGEPSPELISTSVTGLQLRYFDGQDWLDAWETTEQDLRLPWAISIQLTLRDARQRDHVYQTIIPVPNR